MLGNMTGGGKSELSAATFDGKWSGVKKQPFGSEIRPQRQLEDLAGVRGAGVSAYYCGVVT